MSVRVTEFSWAKATAAAAAALPRAKMSVRSSKKRLIGALSGLVLLLGALLYVGDPDQIVSSRLHSLSLPSSWPLVQLGGLAAAVKQIDPFGLVVPATPITTPVDIDQTQASDLATPTEIATTEPAPVAVIATAVSVAAVERTKWVAVRDGGSYEWLKCAELDGGYWWRFTLDVDEATAQEIRNATLVQISITIAGHTRILWQSAAHSQLGALRTNLGRILKVTVPDPQDDEPAKNLFLLSPNLLVFEAISDTNTNVATFTATFALGRALFHARIDVAIPSPFDL